METRARHTLVEFHQLFALFKQPQHRRHRAHVHGVRSGVEDVIENARDFRKHRADILRPHRHFDAGQFLDGQHIAVLHAHRRDIIEAVHVGQRLQISLVFNQLFGATVQQADVRIAAFDDFAVQLHHQPQHAVRRRVLRAEIDHVILDFVAVAGRQHIGCVLRRPRGTGVAQAAHLAPAFSSPGST